MNAHDHLALSILPSSASNKMLVKLPDPDLDPDLNLNLINPNLRSGCRKRGHTHHRLECGSWLQLSTERRPPARRDEQRERAVPEAGAPIRRIMVPTRVRKRKSANP